MICKIRSDFRVTQKPLDVILTCISYKVRVFDLTTTLAEDLLQAESVLETWGRRIKVSS